MGHSLSYLLPVELRITDVCLLDFEQAVVLFDEFKFFNVLDSNMLAPLLGLGLELIAKLQYHRT